jgi:hypothetical protein
MRPEKNIIESRKAASLLLFVALALAAVPLAASQGAVLDRTGEWWVYMEGPEVNEEKAFDYPYFLEARVEYPEACVFNGTGYLQGSMKDVGTPFIAEDGTRMSLEAGGWHGDKELCINIPGRGDDVSGGIRDSDNYPTLGAGGQDWGGEWYDLDQWFITKHMIQEHNADTNPEGALRTDNWTKYWVENPDKRAACSTGVINNDCNITDEGFALEDDCSQGEACEDIRDDTGYKAPYWANFTEGARGDDYTENPIQNSLDNFHNRVQAGGGTGHGASNTQDDEPSDLNLAWDENSEIDPKDDEWALTANMRYALANNGTPFPPGNCYGAPREQGVNKDKADAVYANSYARGRFNVYEQELSGPYPDGDWIDPDEDWNSIIRGGITCDLTGTDWGFGFGNESVTDFVCQRPVGPNGQRYCDADGDPTSPGDEAFDDYGPHAVRADFKFDYEENPGAYNQDDLQQWPDACGDDKQEYLIREHAASIGGESDPTFSGRNNYYACADRQDDCVFNGTVYSEGQLVDISDYGDIGDETGVDSNDDEICVDLDPAIPGGEWYDPDNETIRGILIGNGTAKNPEHYVREQPVNTSDPGYVVWHDGSDNQPNGAHEAMISPYNPVNYQRGYALEDDCDPALKGADEGCDDSGIEEGLGTEPVVEDGLVYSPFVEDMYADDYNVFDARAVRMYVSNGTASGASKAHGATTGQDMENVPNGVFEQDRFDKAGTWPTDFLNDSTIDLKEDTWALTKFTYHAVGPTGKIWTNGSCYGAMPNETSRGWITKDEKVVGNSFAKAMEVNSDGNKEGVWVDPDSTPKSVTKGGYSCDLNATDWGIGYNNGSGKKVWGADSKESYEEDDLHVVKGDITFDINSDPNGVGASRNLKQYPDLCGDDRNEYLIREHNDSMGNTEQDPNLNRDDIYVCADRISDCAFHGEVYSEGQLVDVSNSAVDEETGVDSVDEEVCVDADPTVPGGEWYDVDNESLNKFLKGNSYTDDDPSTYEGLVRDNQSYNGNGVKWFTDDYPPAAEAEISPYHDLNYSDGYALEDDCAENVQYCEDSGPEETHFEPDAVYSYFEEGRREDDSNVFDGRSVRMYVGYANGTAYYEHGKSNSQDEENTDDTVFDSRIHGWPTEGLNDSTIDQNEDTWAISAELSWPVGPTGHVWENGSCYGKNPWKAGDVRWVNKNQKVVANSYAMAVDVDGYPLNEKKGVWVNPDSTFKSATSGITSCDLNATDWGYGYNTGDGDNLQVIAGDQGGIEQPTNVRGHGYDPNNPHVVTGDIVFDINSDPKGKGDEHNLPQYPDACGDDKNEFLIREHRSFPDESEHNATLEDDDIYGCADRISDCIYNGEIYSMGQTRDVSDIDQELGVNSEDAEVCVDTNPNIPGGEWQDPDNSSIQYEIVGSGTFEQPQTYEGFPSFQNASGGVHWFNTSYAQDLQYPIKEAYNSPYNPVNYTAGYAFEDDCGERVEWCEDSGRYENHSQGKAVYSTFVDAPGEKADDGSVGDGYVIRTFMGGCAQHGCDNEQEDENVQGTLPTLNDSTIDPNEDTWAIGSKPYYGVGPTGEVYPNGTCYGRSNPDYKGETIVANSYVLAHDVDGDGVKEGDWVDPDNYKEAVIKGKESCSVTNLTDWGLGFNEGPGSDLQVEQGRVWKRGYNNTPDWQYHIVSGPIQFDNESVNGGVNPGAMEQDDQPQFKDACGDDKNEHLIREHTSNATEDEHVPLLDKDGRQNIYGCADRISDCVFNGHVYSEGQLVDVGAAGNESGSNSTDMEVCIDTDERIPGGEWHDIDNTTWRNYLTGESNASHTFIEDDPSTYLHLVANDSSMENYWLTDRNQHAAEVERTPFNPLNYSDGYALEDDCDPDLDYCADLGGDRQFMPGHSVYSSFIEGEGEDDSNILNGKAVRLWVGYANGTAWADHGESNEQSEENAGDLNFTVAVEDWDNGGTEDAVIPLNDSTIDEREDTWAIADDTSDVVGPTGHLYEPGSCYGSNASTIMENWVQKNETVMANSFAYAVEVDGDDDDEGVWINPDSTPKSLTQGNFSCDLNSTDWGIGYNTGVSGRNSDSDADLQVHHGDARSEGYEVDDVHAVSGPITFDYQSDPPGITQDNKPQYPSACGDDGNEYLIREHRTFKGDDDENEYNADIQTRDNIYVCADRISDCAYNGYVFSEGDTIDISSLAPSGEDPERGEDINDEEICLDLDKSIPGGEWYDKDSNWTVRSKIMELNTTEYEVAAPSGNSCSYTLSGNVWGYDSDNMGTVHIEDGSTPLQAGGVFSMSGHNMQCGSTQVIEYREDGDLLRAKRIALPNSDATIDEIDINLAAAFDPIEAWAGIKANQDHDFGFNPGTDWKNRTHKLERKELGYFNRTGTYTAVYDSYKPEGYATEDDCGKLMKESGTGPCGDVGKGTQNGSWISAGNFSYNTPTNYEGAKQDNYDTEDYTYYGYHNRMQDSSDQLEPGAATERNWNLSDVYGVGYTIYDSRDSTPGPDNWALTRYRNYSVDNRGRGYPPGTAERTGCYYRPGVTPRTSIDNDSVSKKQKVFGNSFANASDYDGDSKIEGVWEDPDEVLPSYSNFSCDITGPDKGYGYDTGPNDGEFHYKNNDRSTHVVIGDIAYATVEGKTGSFEQEPPACGDDHKEYLIEELGAAHNSLENTGRWGCGTDYDDCVSRSGGEYAIYRKGDLENTEEAAEDFGRAKNDKEICEQNPDDKYGVWYDQDYNEQYCQENNLYGPVGVRWITPDHIDRHPYSVVEGINDDLNPYLHKNEGAGFTSTQGDPDYSSGETPVPTGKYVNGSIDQYYTNYDTWTMPDNYRNLTATKGFCAGDDVGETVIVQKSSTSLLRTNYSVMGVADSEDDCVLDAANYPEINDNKRRLYSPGENVTLNLDGSTRTASCYGGRWYANWPVVFLQDHVDVEQGTQRDITFKVINVEDERTTYEVDLYPSNDIAPYTTFNSFDGSFNATVPPQSSRQFSVEVYGADPSLGPENIQVRAASLDGSISGTDNVTAGVINEVQDESEADGSASEVPGIGGIQMMVLMLLASLMYYTRMLGGIRQD